MAKFYEEMNIEENCCDVTVYLEFLGNKLKIATKSTTDAFETINVEYFDDSYRYALEENLSGYTVYNLLINIQESVKDGDFKRLHRFLPTINEIESKAKTDIKEMSNGNSGSY